MLIDGDIAAAHVTMQGTHSGGLPPGVPGTHKRFAVRHVHLVRFGEDRRARPLGRPRRPRANDAGRATRRSAARLTSGASPSSMRPDTPHGWERARGVLNAAGYRTIVRYLRGYHPDTILPGRG